MKQIKSQILSINGKKAELYQEENNIFLMSHNSKWNKPEGLQPAKMHSWKCAAFICEALKNHESLSIDDVWYYSSSFPFEVKEVKEYEVKFTRTKEDDEKQEQMQQDSSSSNDDDEKQKQEQMQEQKQEQMQQMKMQQEQKKQEQMQKQMKQMQGDNKMQMMMQMMQMMMQPESPANDEEVKALKQENETMKKALDAALQRIEALENNAPTKVEYEFTSFNGTHKIEGLKHKIFEAVAKAINMNIPAYLFGPAGSGKNVLCEQIAKAFGLDFYYSNSVTQEYKITGHSDINGNLVETEFYKAFTQGGLFMLDEVDSSDPNALIVLNAALANGYFDFPVVGKKMMHENFRCIAAGNTKGTGATLQYSSRFIIDEATRDRFCFFEVDYDEKIEAGIIKAYDADDDILPFVYDIRKSAKKNSISVLAGNRLVKNLAKLTKAGFSVKDAINAAFFNKYNEDDMSVLAGDLTTYNNKFTEAFKRLAA